MVNKAIKQLYDLQYAIFSLDYDRVQQYLTDESYPINIYFPRFKKLPRDQVIESQDLRMIELFLSCPRVDWLKLNDLDFDDLDYYGIEYDQVSRDRKQSRVL